MMYDGDGKKTREAQLDIYGRVHTFVGSSLNRCNWRYQGQYFDEDISLCYNRFRWYDQSIGSYISQDPIRVLGGNNLYGYVPNTNIFIDTWGLLIQNKVDGNAREAIALEQLKTEHPNGTILKERYLRDAEGNSVKDVGIGGTGERRRVDFVVIEDGKVVKVVEVTSASADKRLQIEKEGRIRDAGGTYIREPGSRGKKGLYDISNVQTERRNIDLDAKHVH